MSDLISRQSAIGALDSEITVTGRANAEVVQGYVNLVADRIKRLPSAQPEIIRCKDCKHYNAGFECLIEGYGIERDKEWYCGDAERREE